MDIINSVPYWSESWSLFGFALVLNTSASLATLLLTQQLFSFFGPQWVPFVACGHEFCVAVLWNPEKKNAVTSCPCWAKAILY